MDSRDGPSADVPILLFLICAIAVIGVFASTVVWLNRPTVIVASTDYEATRKVPVLLLTSSALAEEREARAVSVADKANAELGLRQTQMARNDPPPEPAAKQPAVKQAAAKKPKPKPRPVARAQSREREYVQRRPRDHEWRSFGSAWFGPAGGLFFN